MDFFEKNISSLNKRYNYIIDKIRKENTKKQTDEYGIENKADGNIVLYKNYLVHHKTNHLLLNN